MDTRGKKSLHKSLLLLFLALVLGAAVFALVLVSGDQPDGQLTRLVVFGVSVAVLVCASLQQWWVIRQLQKTSERILTPELKEIADENAPTRRERPPRETPSEDKVAE